MPWARAGNKDRVILQLPPRWPKQAAGPEPSSKGASAMPTAPAPHAPASLPGDKCWGHVGAAGCDEPRRACGACSCPRRWQGLRTRLNVDTSTPTFPQPARVPTQPAPQPPPLLRTPAATQPQGAGSPPSPAGAAACGARAACLMSRCLQLLSLPEAARVDELHQENKIQRVEQPQDLAWVVGLRKQQEIQR